MSETTSRIRSPSGEPTFPNKSRLSSMKAYETLTTLCSRKLASPGTSNMFPGASAWRRLEVSEQTTTVFILLALNTLFCTTIAGSQARNRQVPQSPPGKLLPDGSPVLFVQQPTVMPLYASQHGLVFGVWILVDIVELLQKALVLAPPDEFMHCHSVEPAPGNAHLTSQRIRFLSQIPVDRKANLYVHLLFIPFFIQKM